EVAGVETLHHRAVRAVHQPFGLEPGEAVLPAEVDEQLHAPTCRLRGYRGFDVKPRRAPGRSPSQPHVGGLVAPFGDGGPAGQRLRRWDGFALSTVHMPHGQPDRGDAAVHSGLESLVEDTVQALLDEGAIVVHGGSLLRSRRRAVRSGLRYDDVGTFPAQGTPAIAPVSSETVR